jgi:hypothetical protein
MPSLILNRGDLKQMFNPKRLILGHGCIHICDKKIKFRLDCPFKSTELNWLVGPQLLHLPSLDERIWIGHAGGGVPGGGYFSRLRQLLVQHSHKAKDQQLFNQLTALFLCFGPDLNGNGR